PARSCSRRLSFISVGLMRQISKYAKQAAKHFLIGACEGLGAIAIGLAAGWIGTRRGPIGEAARHLVSGLAPRGKEAATISLIALSTAFLALWISCEIRLFRLRRRIAED